MKSEPLVESNNKDSDTSTPNSVEFSANVHVYRDDQQLGIYSLEQVHTLLREGILVTGDLAWVDGCDSYMPIESVSGLMQKRAT